MYAAALSPETALLTDAVAVSTALAPPEAAATMAGGDATLRFFGLGDTPSALALERVIAADVEGTADVEVAEVAAAPDEVADEPLKCLLVFIAAEQKDWASSSLLFELTLLLLLLLLEILVWSLRVFWLKKASAPPTTCNSRQEE
jgi:hypothetical protein